MRFRKYPQLWQGCIGAWCMSRDKSRSTRLTDFSRYNNHGTLTSMDPATDWVASNGRMVLDFDGSDDRVLASQSKVFSEGTLSAWVKTTSSSAFKCAFGFSSSSTGTPIFFLGSGITDGTKAGYMVRQDGIVDIRVDSVTALNTGYWTHIAVTWSPTMVTGYMSGRIEVTSAIATNSVLTGNQYSIGNLQRDAPAFYFTGQVDDCRAYDRCISQSVISLLARRPGIAYETARPHRYKTASAATVFRNRSSRYLTFPA